MTNNDLISREALKKCAIPCETHNGALTDLCVPLYQIDNAPTVEVPENEVNCVLTMFGKCSYNKTGCSDCEIKDKIRKALEERPQGEWKLISMGLTYKYQCSLCGRTISTTPMFLADYPFCHCGARMKGSDNE